MLEGGDNLEVGRQTGQIEQDFAKTSEKNLRNPNLNPQGSSFKKRLMAIAAGIGLVAYGGDKIDAASPVDDTANAITSTVTAGAEHVKNAGEEVADKTTTTFDKGTTIGDHARNAVVAPIEGTRDFLEDKFGRDDPAPRIPDAIGIGQVEVTVTDELNLRRDPMIPGKEDQDNTSKWENVKIVNKVTKDGMTTYEPVDFNMGDTLVIKNPEIIYGQNPESGLAPGKWIQLYTVDDKNNPHSRLVSIEQNTTEPGYVRTQLNEDMVEVDKLQNSGGLQIIQYKSPPPQIINSVSVQHNN